MYGLYFSTFVSPAECQISTIPLQEKLKSIKIPDQHGKTEVFVVDVTYWVTGWDDKSTPFLFLAVTVYMGECLNTMTKYLSGPLMANFTPFVTLQKNRWGLFSEWTQEKISVLLVGASKPGNLRHGRWM